MPDPELHAGRIVMAAVAIAATVVGAVAVVLLWLHARQLPPGGAPLLPLTTAHIAGPPLEAAPQPALKAMQAEQAKRLHGLGWVDEPHGIAHIPIEDAMALLAGRAASAPGSQRSQRPREEVPR